MSAPDGGTWISAGIGAVNIGVVVYLIRVVIAPVASAVRSMSDSVKELYESRDAHQTEITEIKTIHRIRGCDLPEPRN